jgi:sugar-phosphatase
MTSTVQEGRDSTEDEAGLATSVRELRAGRTVEISGILFDMDGTLIDSIASVEDAWLQWAEEFDRPMPSLAMHGRTPRMVVEASGLDPALHDRATERLCEIETLPRVRPRSLPGVQHLLDSLPQDSWGIVTSAAGRVATARLGATELPEPPFRISAEDISRSKPDPEPFANGIRELRRRGRAGVVAAFEDTIAGLTSARGAGCLTIGVHGANPAEDLAAYAHIVVPSFTAIRAEVTGPRLALRVLEH